MSLKKEKKSLPPQRVLVAKNQNGRKREQGKTTGFEYQGGGRGVGGKKRRHSQILRGVTKSFLEGSFGGGANANRIPARPEGGGGGTNKRGTWGNGVKRQMDGGNHHKLGRRKGM